MQQESVPLLEGCYTLFITSNTSSDRKNFENLSCSACRKIMWAGRSEWTYQEKRNKLSMENNLWLYLFFSIMCVLQQIEVAQMKRRQPIKVPAILFGGKLIFPVTQLKSFHNILNDGRAFAQQHK